MDYGKEVGVRTSVRSKRLESMGGCSEQESMNGGSETESSDYGFDLLVSVNNKETGTAPVRRRSFLLVFDDAII